MNEMPTFLYFVWIVLSPFLFILLVNRQLSSGIQFFLVLIYLILTIAGVFIFYDLLDLRKNESLTSFYRRKKELKRLEGEQKQKQMSLLATAKAPSLCCRCGQKSGKNDWDLILGEKSSLDEPPRILQWMHLFLTSKQERIILKLKMCDTCYNMLFTSQKIIGILQAIVAITFVIAGIIYGMKLSQVLLYVILFFVIGLLFSALSEFVVNGIVKKDFYKVDWKYRYITFSSRVFQNEFGKINPNFISETKIES